MELTLENLFPTPLARTRLNHDVSSLIASISDDLHPIKGQTNNTHLLDLPQFQSLRNEILPLLNSFMRDILRIDGDTHITQSWANRNEPGQSHHEHSHPNSFVSAVFYLQAPEGSSITFHRSTNNNTYTMMPAKLEGDNGYTSPTIEMPVETNDFIMFPSYLIHSVGPNAFEVDRWSLALNCVTSNVIGHETKLNELRIV